MSSFIDNVNTRIERLENLVHRQREQIKFLETRINIIINSNKESDIDNDSITMLKEFCTDNNISFGVVVGRRGDREATNQRYIAADYLFKSGKSKHEISRIFDRDHTTIKSLLKRGLK